MKFFKINNKCNYNLDNSEDLFHGLGSFAQKRFGFKKPPAINLVSDKENGSKPLGKTAYYDPDSLSVTIYTDNRHVKDILRSLAHELVHHTQNENGELDVGGYHGQGYAQKNKNLRAMEKDAYERGNLCFRDFEDKIKQKHPTTYNERRIKDMSTKEWKRKELMENLSDKFGFKMDLSLLNEASCGSKDKKMEEELNEEEGEECPKCNAAPCKCPDEKKVMKEEEKEVMDEAFGRPEVVLDKIKKADCEELKEMDSKKFSGKIKKAYDAAVAKKCGDKKESMDEKKDGNKFTKKYDDKVKGKQKNLPDPVQKAIINKEKQNESRIYKFIKQEIRKQLKERK